MNLSSELAVMMQVAKLSTP